MYMYSVLVKYQALAGYSQTHAYTYAKTGNRPKNTEWVYHP